jgi:hypothetical protein
VKDLRELYRQDLNCQIIRDSFVPRGLADPYRILVDGRLAGYGAVANKYDKGRLVEFYTLPQTRQAALPICRELLAASNATHLEAQTNNPLMLLMLFDCARNIKAENILFQDVFTSSLPCPKGIFRHATPADVGLEDEWLVEPIRLPWHREDFCVITIRPMATSICKCPNRLGGRVSEVISSRRSSESVTKPAGNRLPVVIPTIWPRAGR